jgi:hypothetical protein
MSTMLVELYDALKEAGASEAWMNGIVIAGVLALIIKTFFA